MSEASGPVSEASGPVVLLGSHPDVGDFRHQVDRFRGDGGVAWITAGRQEWEDEDGAIRDALDGEGFNLRLYARGEEVWSRDPELADAHRAHQRRLRLLRRAYNLRLQRLMDGWARMAAMVGDARVLDPEREAALDDVRRLDEHHLRRIEEARRAFEAEVHFGERDAVREIRAQLAERLDHVRVVAMAGGHVPVLLNRLRLFDMLRLLASRTLVAWGGGTMVLARRVVLFHDSPPWGPGHAEVGEAGLGRVPGVIPLPSASRRLRLDDADRVDRMARRFEPDDCLLMDHGARAEWDGHRWTAVEAARLGEHA
ncbi:MAG: hypothetical protein KJO11_03965 [Gemmatimonadetes bacterium]|nr:hypothetical protein [Gemmatimonadota bacterium]